MPSKKYRLRYLPLFCENLDEKVTYITEVLRNPKAANDLLDKVEAAIMERLPVAESFEPYHSIRERKYSYYRIYNEVIRIMKRVSEKLDALTIMIAESDPEEKGDMKIFTQYRCT